FAMEILRVYFIMPFPGSQRSNSIDLAYWLARNITWLRLAGLLLVAYGLARVFKFSKTWRKVTASIAVVAYFVVFFMFNFRFEADRMFYQPKTKSFASATDFASDTSMLVIGVALNGEAKAYPIQVIGYHHQVRDTVGGLPVMVTYCTVCRTGRVFSPVINGKPELFRLVGMDHFNAMFEDATTKSWWQQATGEAIAGSLKGTKLKEIPSRQVKLASWWRLYPDSKVLRRDTLFTKKYAGLDGYDRGTLKSKLEKRDSGSWKFKSWVIGVAINSTAKAYDWNQLIEKRIIQDSFPGLPLLITLENDTASFHVLSRRVDGRTLQFEREEGSSNVVDLTTRSIWTPAGLCVNGDLRGRELMRVQAYQEFWHSWQAFHPGTLQYPDPIAGTTGSN
ncbi:MAG TPA: DUF3179 domain-containing (seleno)protein, partial [Chitinophagaceae bacterium]|nr:DUF3179 domain-containing (seleno)protein [Chitinophagaceae bacterium]